LMRRVHWRAVAWSRPATWRKIRNCGVIGGVGVGRSLRAKRAAARASTASDFWEPNSAAR
jgi:hypothetical protein